MGQIRHAWATTTQTISAAIQRSEASIAALSRELGINSKTAAKWRKRRTVEDRKAGPQEPRSTILDAEEEAMIVTFGGTRRCHWMIASMRCSPAFRTHCPQGDCLQSPGGGHDLRCIAAFSHDQLRSHLAGFLDACNFARRLKTLSGFTPCE